MGWAQKGLEFHNAFPANYKSRKSSRKRSIAIMNSEKTGDNVSFKVFLRNLNNEGEVKRFVVDSDAATSITYLQVK